MYSPLMAIVGISGNLRRTIESSSNPDMPAILKSQRITILHDVLGLQIPFFELLRSGSKRAELVDGCARW